MACAQGWVKHLFKCVYAPFLAVNDEVLQEKTSVMEDTGSESTAPRGIIRRSLSSGSSGVEYMTDTDDEADHRPCDSEQLLETPVLPTVQTTKTLVRSNSLDQLTRDIKAAFRSNVRTKQKVFKSMPELSTGISDQEALKLAFRASVQSRKEAARAWLAERSKPTRSDSFEGRL